MVNSSGARSSFKVLWITQRVLKNKNNKAPEVLDLASPGMGLIMACLKMCACSYRGHY